MARQWQVDTYAGRCAVTGRPLLEGESFYSVLFEEGDMFKRMDISVDAWSGPPEGSYCHFKTSVPVKEKKKKVLVDNGMITQFFLRLADETEPVRVQFRFVLALILMRKKILRYVSTVQEDGVEVWKMTLRHDPVEHRVLNPAMTDDQIDEVSGQLSAILHSDMGEWAAASRDDVSDISDELSEEAEELSRVDERPSDEHPSVDEQSPIAS